MRKGDLSEDFETAFEQALEEAVESIARTLGLGGTNQAQDLDQHESTQTDEVTAADIGENGIGADRILPSDKVTNPREPRKGPNTKKEPTLLHEIQQDDRVDLRSKYK